MLTRLRLVLAWVGLFSVLAPAAVAAISQGYKAAGPLPAGSIVSLAPDSKDTVEATSTQNASRMLGVVVDQKLPNATEGEVQVATTGNVPMLVSTVSGEIKAGDRIGPSPLAGVGAKAASGSRAIGVAQSDFAQASAGSVGQDVKTADGQTRRVFVGAISVVIEPAKADSGNTEFVPDSAQNFINALAGKPVAPTRVILAAALVALTLVFVSIMVSSAVRSGMTAIGRNPLTKQTVVGSLFRVLMVAFFVMAGSLGASYLIITR